MKKSTTFFVLCSLLTGLVFAYPLSEGERDKIVSSSGLVDDMRAMMAAMFELESHVVGGAPIRYDVLEGDADRILEAVEAIRKKDKTRVFKRHLDDLAKDARRIYRYARKKDPRVKSAVDAAYESCFQCHAEFRK